MLPMGTIVTACMFAGLVIAADLPILRSTPRFVKKFIAIFVLAAGLWNTLWYGLQHLSEFWGLSALISGILMIIVSFYILAPGRLPQSIRKIKPILLVVLLGYAIMYAVTIARL